jgi:T5SS/PEP-CTERM-associated repeat protein/autotransporter-associated beta strand protein
VNISSGTWNNSSSLTVGNSGVGSLTISGGTASNTTATIGNSNGSTGSVTVNSGGTWNNSGDLSVGRNGTGSMTVSGGTVFNANAIIGVSNGSTGSVTVNSGTWSNASGLSVGSFGAGSLTINGGTVSSLVSAVGALSGSTGSVTVNSGGTWTNSGYLVVGRIGTGSLTINGGTVFNTSSDLGYSSGSTGSVTVNSGGIWNNAGSLTVGNEGTGSLTINGGTVFNTSSDLGYFSGSTGSVTVNSGGTWNNAGSLTVGRSGNGSLTIENSGLVTVGNGTGTLFLASNLGKGTLNIGTGGSAGTLQAAQVSVLTLNGTINFNHTNAGYLFGAAISGTLTVNQLGSGTTTLTGLNTYSGTTTISAGTLQVGNGGTNGTLGKSAVTNNATLAFNRSNGLTVTNRISGSGSLAQNGGGTLTLSEAKTYTGGTVINAGTLATAGNETLADSGAVTVNSGGTFKLGGNETIASLNGAGTADIGAQNLTLSSGSFSGALAGSGDLYKSSANAFTLSGTSTGFSGDIYLQNGSVVANSSTALNANNFVLLSAGSTFTANQSLVLGGIDQNGGTINGSGVITAVSTITRSGELNSVLGDVTGYNSGLLKIGTGTTTIGAANTYTGTTKVSEGTLALGSNGSYASTSSAQINSGATLDLAAKNQSLKDVKANGSIAGTGTMTVTGTLSGSGTVNADTVIEGTHSPGNSPGIQSFGGNLTYNTGAGILLQFTGNTTNNSPVNYDQIMVGKNLNFNGLTTLNLDFGDAGSVVDWNNAFWQSSQSWTLYSVSGATTGFENLTLNTTNWTDARGDFFGNVLTGGTFSLAQNGNNVVLNYAVPEPSTYVLFGLGALALLIAYRRKKAA